MLHLLNRRTHISIVFLRDSVILYCKNLPSIAICVMFSCFVSFALFETSCVVETQKPVITFLFHLRKIQNQHQIQTASELFVLFISYGEVQFTETNYCVKHVYNN